MQISLHDSNTFAKNYANYHYVYSTLMSAKSFIVRYLQMKVL